MCGNRDELFAGCAEQPEAEAENVSLNYKGEGVSNNSKTVIVGLNSSGAEFNDDISAENISLDDAFSGMTVDKVRKTESDKIDVTLKGKIADEGVFGDITVDENSFKKPANPATAEVKIVEPELYIDTVDFSNNKNSLILDIVTKGYFIDTSLISKMDINFEKDATLEVKDVNVHNEHSVSVILDRRFEVNPDDWQKTVAELENNQLMVSGKVLGSDSDVEVKCTLPWAGLTGEIKPTGKTDADGVEARLLITVNNGTMGDVSKDNIVLKDGLSGSKITNVKKNDNGNIEVTLIVKQVDKDGNFGGNVELTGVEYKDLFGFKSSNNKLAVNYSSCSAESKDFASTANFFDKLADKSDALKGIPTGGSIDNATSFISAMTDIVGTEANENDKVFSEISVRLKDMQKQINTLTNGQDDDYTITQLTNFNNYATNLTNICGEFYRDYFNSLSGYVESLYPNKNAFWSAIGTKYMKTNDKKLSDEAADRKKWKANVDKAYNEYYERTAYKTDDIPEEAASVSGDQTVNDDDAQNKNDAENHTDTTPEESTDDDFEDELKTQGDYGSEQWSDESGTWEEQSNYSDDTARSVKVREPFDEKVTDYSFEGNDLYKEGLEKGYYLDMPLNEEDIAKEQVAVLYEKAKSDLSVMEPYTNINKEEIEADILTETASRYSFRTVNGSSIKDAYESMCELVMGKKSRKIDSMTESYDKLINSSYNWDSEAYNVRKEIRPYLQLLIANAYPIALACDLDSSDEPLSFGVTDKYFDASEEVQNNPAQKMKEDKKNYIYCLTTNKYYYKEPQAYRPYQILNDMADDHNHSTITGTRISMGTSIDDIGETYVTSDAELTLIVSRAANLGRTMREDLIVGGFTGPGVTTYTNIKYLASKFHHATRKKHLFEPDEYYMQANAVNLTASDSAEKLEYNIEVMKGELKTRKKDSFYSINEVLIFLSTKKGTIAKTFSKDTNHSPLPDDEETRLWSNA